MGASIAEVAQINTSGGEVGDIWSLVFLIEPYSLIFFQ